MLANLKIDKNNSEFLKDKAKWTVLTAENATRGLADGTDEPIV